MSKTSKGENSRIEDQELFLEYCRTKDASVRNEIVSKYMYLVEIISKKFVNRGIEYEDIYQVAAIALIKAVERFKVDENVKFVSYATPTIIGEVKRFFRDKASVIRVPRRIYEVYQKVNQAREHLIQQNQRSPKIQEIAEYLNMSEESILEIIESWNVYNIQSFDQTVYNEDDLELYETVGEEDLTFERIDNRDFLRKTMSKCNPVEKQFIKMRYFEGKTQKEIASVLGVSQMYISRLEKKTLERFRKIMLK